MTTYTAPAITDYGSLIEMTADTSLLVPGLAATTSQLSSPGGGGTTPGGDSGAVAPQQTSGTETTPTDTTPSDGSDSTCEDGSTAGASAVGADAAQADCDTTEVADQNQSGDSGGAAGSSGGGGSTGGGDDALPFTGFPAGLVAGLGGAVTAAGVALKSAVGRNRSY